MRCFSFFIDKKKNTHIIKLTNIDLVGNNVKFIDCSCKGKNES